MNVTAIEIAKLNLAPGETLVVMTPERISIEQREGMVAALQAGVGASTRVLILDGGMTLATLSKAELDPGTNAAEPAPNEERAIMRRGNGAPFKELLDGVETRMSIVAYKLWLKAEGAECEHAYRPDRFGPAGQSICTYCRAIKNPAPTASAP